MARKKKKEGGMLSYVAAAAVGAAASYFFYGPNRTKNRKKAQAWAYKAKAEVLEELEPLKEVGKKEYETAVEKVARRYKAAKYAEPAELKKLEQELKRHWGKIAKHLPKQAKKKARA